MSDDFVKRITQKLKKVDEDTRLKGELAVRRGKTVEAHPNSGKRYENG